MAVMRTFAADPEQSFQEIDNIIKSHSLRGSESLCRLLQYLAEHSLSHPPATVKEYQIATEVFGRPSNFDPQSDSTVRVQAGRLRAKLAEYYASEGADDPLVVSLPKGSYHLVFEARPVGAHHEVDDRPTLVTSGPKAPSDQIPSYWRFVAVGLAVILLVALVSLGSLLRSRQRQESSLASPVPANTAALRAFWQPFISGPEEPWVIFSNAAFVGRPETGLRYFNSQQDARSAVRDHYTGVGEVLAVHELDEAFSTLGRRIRAKRGSLFSLDDAKNTDLVFVGSPSENLSLLDIPGTQEFVFQRVSSGPRQGDLAIVIQHPRPGESSTFLASPSNDPLTEDYGVIGLVPGLDPARYVMILAGTTTFGTQGTVEFVCHPDSVERLLQQVPRADSGAPKPFEALVHVKIARGVPVETELVAVRTR
jgi:hypothetical protein